MSLDEYKRKRDFTTSPEPAGHTTHRSPGGRAPRRFCVQKHLASHLHYDLRLEHDGVLLSWAVPKGPSLDPATKRLAMHVEDHPIEYGTFEGVIPSGYGAGVVMLWDEGTWTPEVDDVDAAMRKGDLKFTLAGVKLKGSWVLVRTRGWGGGARAQDGRSWLLIKHRDDWSGDLDIAEFAPLSVKSGGDFAEILSQEDPAIWESEPRGRRGGADAALFDRIVRQALDMRAAREPDVAAPPRAAAKTGAARQAPAATKTRARAPAAAASKKTTRRSSTTRTRR